MLAGAVLALIAGCGSTGSGVSATKSNEASPVASPSTTATTDTAPLDTSTVPVDTTPTSEGPFTPPLDTTPPPVGGGIISFGEGKTPQPYDNFLNAAFADITTFWAANFEATYGTPFQPVAGIFAVYPGRIDPIATCQDPITFPDVEQNAFYTSCGDIIVYDDAELFPDLVNRLGAAAIGVAAAHEYGHAIQHRAGVFDIPGMRTIDTEQQADCFAGAWSAHVARGEAPGITFGDNEVKAGLVAMIEVRDPPGFDSEGDSSGHGSAFDRVGAFQEGFINGIPRCQEFPTNPNPRIDLKFTAADEQTQGNLPLAELLDGATSLPLSLQTLWVPTLQAAGITFTPPTLAPFPEAGPFPTCDGYTPDQLLNNAVFCQNTNTIAYDDDFLQSLYNQFGDLAFGYPIIAAYSDAVQVALQSSLSGEPRVLLNDCLVGAYLLDVLPSGQLDASGNEVANNPSQGILLSAGDLDEVVSTAVLEGDPTSDTNRFGTAFEKIDAFRAGVVGGLGACQARING
jgi:predicted metalloprotease